jgi:Ca-activated chloride channel family protein
MSFLHPEFLYYLLPPMFILFGLLLTQKEAHAHFFSQEVMDKLRVSANTLTLKARNALFLLIGVLIVVSLAQPVIKGAKIEIKAKSSDIVIALDISDSMLAEDIYPSRLGLAKKKAIALLKDAPNERLGVVAFAKSSYLVSPLSFDSDAVAFLLSKLDTASITQQGTDILALLEVVAEYQSKSKKKYLLILSDGGDKDDFSKEIEYAKEKNIIVFVLGMGTKEGAPIKKQDGTFIKYNGDIIISKLNESISTLATQTGGVYIQNTTADKDIKTMFKEMQSVSDKKELKSQEIQKHTPLFYYPLGLALFILLIATSSMSKRVKVDVPNVFLVFLLLGASVQTKAGLLDFLELDKAKKAYEAGEYERAAKIYESYADAHESGQSYYNAANSYYKKEDYEKALELYQKATFNDKDQRAGNLANIGNTHLKTQTKDSLIKAKESYEKSLALKEDKDVRENLEMVKKEIEKQKQNKQNKDEQEKDNQEKDNQEEDKQNQDKQDKNSSDKKEGDKDSKPQDSKSEEKEDEQKQDKKEQDKPKEDDSKLQNLSDENNESKKDDARQEVDAPIKQMSDAELEKWLEQLQNQQKTFLYKLNKTDKRQDEDEKPW